MTAMETGRAGATPDGWPAGALLFKGFLGAAAQAEVLAAAGRVAAAAPLVRPLTPWGKPMSVGMTSAGDAGWVTDRKGYRYEPRHPETGSAWPPIPQALLSVWDAVAAAPAPPDSALFNHYGAAARMGLHQDKDEADFGFPVVSLSIGAPCTFRMGGLRRDDPTRSVILESGDVLVIGGAARLAFHGVDRIRKGGPSFPPPFAAWRDGDRLNVTLRRAAPAP